MKHLVRLLRAVVILVLLPSLSYPFPFGLFSKIFESGELATKAVQGVRVGYETTSALKAAEAVKAAEAAKIAEAAKASKAAGETAITVKANRLPPAAEKSKAKLAGQKKRSTPKRKTNVSQVRKTTSNVAPIDQTAHNDADETIKKLKDAKDIEDLREKMTKNTKQNIQQQTSSASKGKAINSANTSVVRTGI